MKLISDKEKIFFLNLEQQIMAEIPKIFFDEKLTSTWLQDYDHPNKKMLEEFNEKRIELKKNGIHLEKEKEIKNAKIIIGEPSVNRKCFILNRNINSIITSIADLCLLDKNIIQVKKIEYHIGEKKFYIKFYIANEINHFMNHYFFLVIGKTQKYIENYFNYKDEILTKEMYLSYLKEEKFNNEIYHKLRECKKNDILNLISLINMMNY